MPGDRHSPGCSGHTALSQCEKNRSKWQLVSRNQGKWLREHNFLVANTGKIQQFRHQTKKTLQRIWRLGGTGSDKRLKKKIGQAEGSQWGEAQGALTGILENNGKQKWEEWSEITKNRKRWQKVELYKELRELQRPNSTIRDRVDSGRQGLVAHPPGTPKFEECSTLEGGIWSTKDRRGEATCKKS